MKWQRTFSIASSCEALNHVLGEVATLLKAEGAGDGAIYAAKVAIEELGINIIRYAYPEGDPQGMDIRLGIGGGELRLQIEDRGIPFNLLEHPEPDLSLPLEERPIGGLGIHLVRKLMDHIAYERLEAGNRVTLLRRLEP